MRARNIKPGFFKNEELAQLPEAVRLLFIGLWCLADRKGRLEDRPLRIKMEIYPCDQHDVSTMLAQLEHHAFLHRYEVNGNRYIQIINFEKHQYPHIHEQASTIPAPCKNGASTMQAQYISPSSLNPSSLNPESLKQNSASIQSLAQVFELFWKEYPKRRGKKLAFKYFKGSVKTEGDVSLLRCALANYKKEIEGKEFTYIKNGSTWFNDWRDYVEVDDASNGSEGVVEYAARARAAREAEKRRREESSSGEISSGVRDMSKISAQT